MEKYLQMAVVDYTLSFCTVISINIVSGLKFLSLLERVHTDKDMAPIARVTIISTKHEVVK